VLRLVANLFDLSLVRARAFVRSAVFFFFFVAGVTALKSATNALFLVRRDPRDLPYLYLATALAITLVTFHVGKRLTRSSAKPVLRSALLVSAGTLLVLGILAAVDFRPALPVLYVAGEVYATAISVLFWARLGEMFDVRAAKRVFGTIAGAGMAGAVLGGLLVRGLAGSVASEVWCFFAVATLIAMFPMIGRDRGKTALHSKKISFREGMVYAVAERFPRGVLLLVLFLSVQTAAVDYVFRTGAVEFETGEAALAGMFGVLNAIVGVSALVVQVFLTGPLLRHIGVFAFLSLIPLLSILCAVWSTVSPHLFAPLFLLKTLEMMGSLSLNQPGLQLFYNPMPNNVRDSVRAIVDGAVKKMGGAAGGVLLIAFGASLAKSVQLGIVVGLALLLLLWIRAMKPVYLDALESKLGARGNVIPSIDPSDRATREQLMRTVTSEDPAKVLAAISVLIQDKKIDLRPHVSAMIQHRDEAVRLRAIELVMESPDKDYAPLLIEVINNDLRRPKAQAARALDLVDPVAAKRVLEPIVNAPPGTHDLGLVCAAISALVETDAAGAALARLLERGRSGGPAERREIARLLGFLGPGPYAANLAMYLEDPEPTVRVVAVHSASIARDPSLPERLIPRLADRAAQHAVRSALAAYGNDVVPLLALTLDDRRLPLELRTNVPRILRQIGTQRSADAMLYSNVNDDAFLRYVIVEELSRLRRNRPEIRFDKQRVHEAAERRIRAYRHYRPMVRDLEDAPKELSLLKRAVQDRMQQNLEAALRVLGLVYDMSALDNAARVFLAREAHSKADALELVDVALQGSELRTEVLESLEAGSLSSLPKQGFVERAFSLVESRDMQLAMIAYETLKRLGEDPQEVREPSTGEAVMPKSIVDRVFALQNVQLFYGLAIDDLAAISALTTEGHARPGEIIYREGDPGDAMYVIVSGDVRLLRGAQVLMDLGHGDSFGQTSILDRGPRPVTAQAGDEGVDYLVLERGPFMDLLIDRPQVVNGLFIVIARRLRELVDLTGGAEPPARVMVAAPSSSPSAPSERTQN
jgi:ATP/ADP translocase